MLSEVVSIDIWHKSFSAENSNADLYADVVFQEGRLGGEFESKIKFRLSIKRAEFIIIIPENEPVKIDVGSVSRDGPTKKILKIVEEVTKIAASAKGEGAVKIGISAMGMNAEANVSGMGGKSRQEKVVEEENGTVFSVQQRKTPDGHYCWDLRSRTDGSLDGRPWIPADSPRLKLIDTRIDRDGGIPPVVYAEVRCRREDLKIKEIELKDKGLWASIKSEITFRNKEVVAEAFIKEMLTREGLEFGDISDSYGVIQLARCVSVEN